MKKKPLSMKKLSYSKLKTGTLNEKNIFKVVKQLEKYAPPKSDYILIMLKKDWKKLKKATKLKLKIIKRKNEIQQPKIKNL